MLRQMLSVPEARRLVLEAAPPPEVEEVELDRAAGRVLAADVVAEEDVPAFDRAAMDGYAVRSADVAKAAPDRPVTLRVVGSAMAGHPAASPCAPGTAVAIATGAPLPPGADAVIRFEETREGEGTVIVFHPAAPGENVSPRAEDMRAGDVALRAGTRLGAPQVGVLAAIGRWRVPVYRSPDVAIIPTGDELVDVRRTPGPGQVRNSTAHALAAAVAEVGGRPAVHPPVPDDPAAIAAAVARAADAGARLVLTTGGASVGRHDHIRTALAGAGGELLFWRLAIKPGKNIAAARRGRTLVVGLSGNPSAALVTFTLVVRPALAAMAGRGAEALPEVRVLLDEEVRRIPGLTRYVRAVVYRDADWFRARPVGSQLASVLSSLAAANALVRIPPGAEPLPAGAPAAATILPGAAEGLLHGSGGDAAEPGAPREAAPPPEERP